MALLVLALALGFIVFCVRFAATMVDAKNGIGIIVFCLLCQVAMSALSDKIASNGFVQFLVAFAGGSLLYSLLLDTSFKKGVIISLISSGMITVGFLVAIGAFGLGSSSTSDGDQAALSALDQRALADGKRSPGYNMTVMGTIMGDNVEMNRCVKDAHKSDNFIAYFEIQADGSLGQTRFVPDNDVAKCFKDIASRRHFPAPPGGSYIARENMNFNRD